MGIAADPLQEGRMVDDFSAGFDHACLAKFVYEAQEARTGEAERFFIGNRLKGEGCVFQADADNRPIHGACAAGDVDSLKGRTGGGGGG